MNFLRKKIEMAFRSTQDGKVLFCPGGRVTPGYVINSEENIDEIKLFLYIWFALNYVSIIIGMIFLKSMIIYGLTSILFIFVSADYAIYLLGIKYLTFGLERTDANLNIQALKTGNTVRFRKVSWWAFFIGLSILVFLLLYLLGGGILSYQDILGMSNSDFHKLLSAISFILIFLSTILLI